MDNKNYNQIKENIGNNINSIYETYAEMWYNIGKSEKGILIPYIIFSNCVLRDNLYHIIWQIQS